MGEGKREWKRGRRSEEGVGEEKKEWERGRGRWYQEGKKERGGGREKRGYD